MPGESSKRFCSRCGNVIDQDANMCPACGKKYFKFSWRSAIIVFLVIATLLLSSTVIYQYFESKDTISALSGRISELEDQMEREKSEYEKEISRLKDRLSTGFNDVYDKAYDDGYEQGKQHQANTSRYLSIHGDNSIAAHAYVKEMMEVTKGRKRNDLKDSELGLYL